MYLYNGLETLLVAEYREPQGDRGLTVDIFQLETSRNSFALYSSLCDQSSPGFDVAAEACARADTLIFGKGRYLVRMYSKQADPAELVSTAEAIATKIAGQAELPEEFEYLPEGWLSRSARLELQDFLGSQQFTGLFSAEYLLDGDTARLFFNLGSDRSLSDVVQEYLGSEGEVTNMIFDGQNQAFIGKHEEQGALYCTMREDILVMVLGYSDLEAAEDLVDRFFQRYHELNPPE
jgi:hypothetical protein